jgi:6-pyruvoyltetrahydropterin/6-carboxytetrahydropterin synthase
MYELMVEGEFSAAHYIKNYGGECSNPHGHNWKVQAVFSIANKNKIGISFDLRILKSILKNILSKLDHKFLNELTIFKDKNPTAENIAEYIYNSLKKALNTHNNKNLKISKILIFENEKSYVSFSSP